MMVSHSNKINVIGPNAINYVERKTLDDSFAEFAGEGCASLRVSNNPFRCLLDGRQKSQAKPRKSRLIKFKRLAHFRPGFRVENRLLHDFLFRNSAKTS